MEIICNPEILRQEFRRLMNNYENYYWSIAWADFDFEQSRLLERYTNRIKRISVGLSFYGTNVKFLKKFKSHTCINFVINSTGTFHPKVYLFENTNKEFEILIGSVNFTGSAFNKNTEFCILVNSRDNDAKKVYEQTTKFINQEWEKGKVIDDDFIKNYNAKKKNLKAIPNLPTRGIFKPIYNKTWKQYLAQLYKVDFQNRIEFLDWVRNKFKNQPHFHKMDLNTRKSIAGFGYEEDVSIGCFGSTNARGYFKNSIIEKPEIITKALSYIPKSGIVNKNNYEMFITEFKKVSKQQEVACATRILCIWRPDYFVNFNGINADSLSSELRISKYKVSYANYWDLIIEPLINAEWSKKPKSLNKKETQIYNNRIALLDCIHANFTD